LLSSSTTQVTRDINVYAVLTIYAYKVTFNPNNGTLTVNDKAYTSSSPYITYTKGTFSFRYKPTRTGYEFNGWSSTPTPSESYVGFFDDSITINSSITYYALWKQLFTVTWANTDASIAIWADGTTTNKTSIVTHGTQYKALTAPAKFANPIKNSGDTIRYTAAWYTFPTNGVLLSSSTTQVTKDITVYAVLTIYELH
jgi:uncharacterized repeat protein (TIGR02543 family)